MNKNYYWLLIPVILVAFAVGFFRSDTPGQLAGFTPIGGTKTPSPSSSSIATRTPTATKSQTPIPTSASGIIGPTRDVTFLAQAPYGNWADPRQQDGCEEAASIMAVYWAKGQTFTKDQGLSQILAISDWEQAKYGSYHDTSAADTAERILKGYFNFTNYELRYDIDVEDIKAELRNGNIVILPANGQRLYNPNFTPPGPERHFLLIKGYDPKTNDFIAHDNGTRQGANYRYKSAVLQGALQDYDSGYHEPIPPGRTAMIVIRSL